MDNQQIMALAKRAERATGPDRELDCRVAAACHPSMAGEFRIVGPPTYAEPRFFSGQAGVDWIGYDLLNNSPAYTASLDAAMTLKADDRWGYDLNSEYGNEKAPGSHTYALTGRHFARIYTPDRGSFEAAAATPALALTAAALKARALTPDPHNG